jgi:glycosyltransferase involved in cell wall biosynthesis
LGYRLIVDAHNAGVSPDGRYSKFVYFLCKYAHRKADVTIVTNPGLAQIIKQNKGKPLILQDRIPQLDIPLHLFDSPFNGNPNVVYICSFGNDEPYREIISAAGNLVSSVNLYVTGNMNNCPREVIQNAASNIHFTGFLPDEQYLSLIHSADCIIDLTEREDCLVCGAYEAVAAERPVILSDTKALRNYFYKGVIYTEHSVSSIGNAILECIVKRDELGKDIVNLRTELEESWLKKAQELNRIIYDL